MAFKCARRWRAKRRRMRIAAQKGGDIEDTLIDRIRNCGLVPAAIAAGMARRVPRIACAGRGIVASRSARFSPEAQTDRSQPLN
jgi:hypothetical protein